VTLDLFLLVTLNSDPLVSALHQDRVTRCVWYHKQNCFAWLQVYHLALADEGVLSHFQVREFLYLVILLHPHCPC